MRKFILLLARFSLTLAAVPALAADNQLNISFKGMTQVAPQVAHADYSFMLFSRLINHLLGQGVSLDVIYLLLTVPFIAFFIAFLRQVIGVSTFGVYTPLMLSLSFLLLGITFGLGVVLIVILISYLLRNIIGRLNLLYIPRTSFLLSCIALSFFLIILFAVNFGSPVALALAIFPMLMISTISEKFSAVQSEEGIIGAVRGVTQTVAVSILSYYLMLWPWLAKLIVSYPEVVIIPLIGSLLIGKFTGLRLVEFFRFRTLFKENIEEE